MGVPLVDGDDSAPHGLTKDEMEASVATLQSIADTTLNAEIVFLRDRPAEEGEGSCFIRALDVTKIDIFHSLRQRQR